MSIGYDLLKGLKVTFKELFRKSVTDKYPKEFRDKPQRFHGRHVLNKYEDGMEKCIGCELCAGACPAQCIYVRGEDNPEDNCDFYNKSHLRQMARVKKLPIIRRKLSTTISIRVTVAPKTTLPVTGIVVTSIICA